MKNRESNIHALLKRCRSDIADIEREYRESLAQKKVGADLQVDIKNLCENLRSVLDYLAHDVRESHCPGAKAGQRFYFPIFDSRPVFEGQASKWFPDLKANAPDVWDELERAQPYHSGNEWLGKFNQLNNENKHRNLVAQTRTETQEVRVQTAGGGDARWNPSAVRFGEGVRIGGVPVDPRTQMPFPSPVQKVSRTIWVDFRFEKVGESALGLLKTALDGVERIVRTVYDNYL